MNADSKALSREYKRRYHEQNRERLNENSRRRYYEKRDARLAKQKEYHQENKLCPLYREKRRSRQIARRQERARWMAEVKAGLKCEKCGEARSPCLDFHHLDPNQKEGSISQMICGFFSKETILAEIAKCAVLCANCHRMVHANERN